MTFNPQVLTDARIYWATADVTGYSNKVELSASVNDLDTTNFASNGWHERVGGLYDSQVNVDSYWQANDLTMPDDTYWANLGVATVPVSVVAPTTPGGSTAGSVGTLVFLTRVTETDYKPGAKVGELLMAPVSGKGDKPLVRGTVMHPQGTARTTTGNGTGVQVGAVLASQRMYCNLHVLSVSGGTPSLTVTLQSSVDNTFSAPTTRITFNASTTLDAQHSSVLGAVTDTWWRATWTISGSSPSFLFNVSAGVGPK